jgi:hypothetical protein
MAEMAGMSPVFLKEESFLIALGDLSLRVPTCHFFVSAGRLVSRYRNPAARDAH